jgi:SAM-dependent methyltransferase
MNGLGAMNKSTKANAAINIDEHQYREFMTEVLNQHYYAGNPHEFFSSEEYQADLRQHTSERYEWTSNHIVPWLRTKIDLAGMHLVEIGCGTGSSTLGFAPHVGFIDCYEISANSIAVAEARLGYWNIANVAIHSVLFDEDCGLAKSVRKIDGIVLFATLEHMTLPEVLEILPLAWRLLRSGGIIIVADTPNRLSFQDYHTSRLPFFSQLPRDLQVRYADRSERFAFKHAIAEAWRRGESEALITMTRWGSGISYHEFELALGPDVHEWIILDGYEEPITRIFGINEVDILLQDIFRKFDVRANLAFARPNMHFVVQKP